MHAGRNLDVLVTKTLGIPINPVSEIYPNAVHIDGYFILNIDRHTKIPDFSPSTCWGSMGVLVEEARKQGWWMHLEQSGDDWYSAKFFDCQTWKSSRAVYVNTAPHAVSLGFLKAKGIEI